MLMNNSCNVSSSTSSSPNQYRGQQGAHEIQNFHHSGHHQGMPLRHNHESQLSYFWIKPFLSSRKEREKSILFASKKKKISSLATALYYIWIVKMKIYIYFRVPYRFTIYWSIHFKDNYYYNIFRFRSHYCNQSVNTSPIKYFYTVINCKYYFIYLLELLIPRSNLCNAKKN